MQLFTWGNITRGLDEHPPVYFVSFTIAVAGMVDPARRISTCLGVNDALFVNMEIESVVRIVRVVRMTRLRFLPGDDLTDVLNNGFASGNGAQREHAASVNTRASHLDAPSVGAQIFFRHKNLLS